MFKYLHLRVRERAEENSFITIILVRPPGVTRVTVSVDWMWGPHHRRVGVLEGWRVEVTTLCSEEEEITTDVSRHATYLLSLSFPISFLPPLPILWLSHFLKENPLKSQRCQIFFSLLTRYMSTCPLRGKFLSHRQHIRNNKKHKK